MKDTLFQDSTLVGNLEFCSCGTKLFINTVMIILQIQLTMMQKCRQIMAELFARTFPERSTCCWANIGTDLLTLSLGTVYLGHIN